MKRFFALVLALLLALSFSPALAESVSYGGNGDDVARGMIALSDGGWLVYGSTTSTDGDFARAQGNWEGETPWAMRLKQNGDVMWHYLAEQDTESGSAQRYLDAAELAGRGLAFTPRFMRICATGDNLIACGEWDEGKGGTPRLYIASWDESKNLDWSWLDGERRVLSCAGIRKVDDCIYIAATIQTDDHPYAQALCNISANCEKRWRTLRMKPPSPQRSRLPAVGWKQARSRNAPSQRKKNCIQMW